MIGLPTCLNGYACLGALSTHISVVDQWVYSSMVFRPGHLSTRAVYIAEQNNLPTGMLVVLYVDV